MADNNTGAIDPQTGTSGNAHTGGPLEHAPEGAHDRLDRKDERTHAQSIEAAKLAEQKEKDEEAAKEEARLHPTHAALAHGNEPSRGAKIDEKLVDEEEEIIRKMDEAKEQAKQAKKH